MAYEIRKQQYQDQLNQIRGAFAPKIIQLSKILPKIPKEIPMPIFPRRNVKKNTDTIRNPITGNYIDNNYENRKRIKLTIQKLNKQRDEIIQQRNEIVRQNTIENKIVGVTNNIDIFANFGKLTIKLQDINSLEQFFEVLKYSINNAVDNLANSIIFNENGARVANKWIASSVQLYWRTPNNKVIIRSMKAGYFSKKATFQQFQNKLDLLEQGAEDTAGSEPINTNEYSLSFDAFGVFIKQLVAGNAKRNIFKVVGIEGKGRCFNECLKYLNLLPEKADFYNVDDCSSFIKFIVDNKIKVNIISNVLDKIDMQNIDDGNMYEIKIKNSRHSDLVYKFNQKYQINYLLKCEGLAKATLIYCPIDNHIDIIKDNNIEIDDDIFISPGGDIYKGDLDGIEKIYSVSEIYKQTSRKKEIQMTVKYVFFDYETIIDWDDSNIMKPYSLSWFCLTEIDVDELESQIKQIYDKEKNFYEAFKKILDKNKSNNHVGFDCSEVFIKWILENQRNHILKFVSYNGANFDNIILLRSLLEYKQNHNIKDDIVIQDIQYNNNQLLNFKINGRHTFYDLRRQLVGSLKSNCESFKIPKEYSKLEFNHNETQYKYNNYTNTDKQQGQIEFINHIKRLESLQQYNDNDVISLSILFVKYYVTISSIKGFDFLKEDFTRYNTIGKIIKTKFDHHIKEKKVDLPKLDITQYEDMQKYKIAGRCEMFNGVQRLEESVCSLDICSMYPYVMTILDCYYPCGKIKKATKYYTSKEKLGFWYCDVDQSALKANNLPNIYAEKTGTENDWGSANQLEKYLLSNITIDLLKSYENIGVKVKIYNKIDKLDENGAKIGEKNSFYFTEKIKSIDMFGFLAEFMKEKNNQDILKNSKDEAYNPALREVLKLAMNSLSGKVIQGLFLDKIGIFDNLADYEKINAKYDNKIINNMGDKLFVSYKIDISEAINRQSPIYLGCFIYEYARTYMYNVLLSKVGLNKCLYQDTDCLKFRTSDMHNWINQYGNQPVPHWAEAGNYDSRYNDNHPLYSATSKVFGSFENELKDNNLFILLQKKVWLVAKQENGEPTYIKTRYKGVNPKSLLLDLSEPFVQKITKKYNIVEGRRKRLKDDANTYDEIEEEIQTNGKDIDIFEWCYSNGKAKEIGSDYEKGKEGTLTQQINFFEQIYKNKFAYVLCNNMRRVVKNSNREVSPEQLEKYNKHNNTIQFINIIKKITI